MINKQIKLEKEEKEYVERMLEEVRSRTGNSIVDLTVREESFEIYPESHHVRFTLTVGNQKAEIIQSMSDFTAKQGHALFHVVRELMNKMFARLIKVGARCRENI